MGGIRLGGWCNVQQLGRDEQRHVHEDMAQPNG